MSMMSDERWVWWVMRDKRQVWVGLGKEREERILSVNEIVHQISE
jgi:hypothetical protein